MSALIARQFIVHGKVQGVFFRKYTEAKANSLGLVGTVENLADGTVKVFAVGSRDAVNALADWCRTEGSPKSKVTGVEVHEVARNADEEAALVESLRSSGDTTFGIIRGGDKKKSTARAVTKKE